MFILILPYLFQRKPQQLLDRLHYLVGDIVGVVNLYLVIHDKIGVSILSPCNAFAFYSQYTQILSPFGFCAWIPHTNPLGENGWAIWAGFL
jgi:hypothetical protein